MTVIFFGCKSYVQTEYELKSMDFVVNDSLLDCEFVFASDSIDYTNLKFFGHLTLWNYDSKNCQINYTFKNQAFNSDFQIKIPLEDLQIETMCSEAYNGKSKSFNIGKLLDEKYCAQMLINIHGTMPVDSTILKNQPLEFGFLRKCDGEKLIERYRKVTSIAN